MTAYGKYNSFSYREDEQAKIERQDALLNPVINHIKLRYNIDLPVCSGIATPEISAASSTSFSEYLNTVDDYEIVALEAAATIAKSTSIALSLIDGFLSIEDALKCARLEEDLQIEEYGKVEGHHDIDELNSRMVLAAAKTLTSFKNLK